MEHLEQAGKINGLRRSTPGTLSPHARNTGDLAQGMCRQYPRFGPDVKRIFLGPDQPSRRMQAPRRLVVISLVLSAGI